MSFDKITGKCFCERCGHNWQAKPISKTYFEPGSCARCKSKGWNKPRVYISQIGAKVIYPMATRYKPTGRQSARIKQIEEQQTKNDQFDKELNSPWNVERAAKRFGFRIENFKSLPNYEQRRMLLEIYYDDFENNYKN